MFQLRPEWAEQHQPDRPDEALARRANPAGMTTIEITGLQDEIRRVVREELAVATRSVSPWLGVEGAADYLSTTPEAIRSRVRRGELVPVRRRPTIFAREDLDAWVRGESG
jgi:Helix-turn-helix domain